MFYINAVELVDCCLKNGVLQTDSGRIPVYRSGTDTSPEGWYLEDKETVIQEIMQNEDGQKVLIDALKQKGVEFTPTDYSWLKNVHGGFQNE